MKNTAIKKANITKPTGNTNPPSTLTMLGLDAVNPVAPPCKTSDNKPPKDNIAPAKN